jgi:monoamine oxidase
MRNASRDAVVIAGAGVSGIRVASLLAARGIPCRLLDARAEPGGRAASATLATSLGEAVFDLGPTWHWPARQPRMRRLVAELGLECFPQHTEGAAWIERFRFERAQRYVLGEPAASPALRLRGGIRALVDGLVATLPAGTLALRTRVVAVRCDDAEAEVEVEAAGGERERIACRAVVLAFPPRLIAGSVALHPALPEALRARFHASPTWLAGQAKAIAVYERPFWREQGSSGLVSSLIGPLQEIHDASPPAGVGALFGFFGLSPLQRTRLGAARLRELAIAQLGRIFGPAAASPIAFVYKDWAEEPSIASPLDLELPNQYPTVVRPGDAGDPWRGRLIFAGSELAEEHNGYLEGALAAAEQAVARVVALDAGAG